jgi:hypothetical protein
MKTMKTMTDHPAAISPLDRLAWLASADYFEERGDLINANDCRNVADGFCNPGPFGLDAFTRSYLECALCLMSDEAGDRDDGNIRELSWEILKDAVIDCAAFQNDNADALAGLALSDDTAGYLFFLSRNGHGHGYFAYDADGLQDAARVYGTWEFMRGDDGTIYSHG